MYKRILVAIDGSEAARAGLDEAVRLARNLGSRLRVVHVLNKTPWISPDVDQSILQRLIDELRGTGECILHDATTEARAAGVEVDSRLIEALGAQVGEFVIQEALSWPADLIVCGTHGRRGVRRLLMGSDAEYVLRHSLVPVLLVRARSSDESAHTGEGV